MESNCKDTLSLVTLPLSIVKHLESELKKHTEGSVDTDFVESIEVAMQCIKSAYALPATATDTATAGIDDLATVYVAGRRALASTKRLEAERLKAVGNAHISAGQPLDALVAYTQALCLDAHNAVYYCNRAAAYSKLGKHEAAIRDCESALREDPGYVKAFGRLGFACAASGQHARAVEYYGRALQMDPGCVSYKQNLATAKAAVAAAESAASGKAAQTEQQRKQQRQHLSTAFQSSLSFPDGAMHRATNTVLAQEPHMRQLMREAYQERNMDALPHMQPEDVVAIGETFAEYLMNTNPSLAELLAVTTARGHMHGPDCRCAAH